MSEPIKHLLKLADLTLSRFWISSIWPTNPASMSASTAFASPAGRQNGYMISWKSSTRTRVSSRWA